MTGTALPSSPPRTALTGASGFLGRALTRHLASRGCDVIALSRARCDAPPGVRQVQLESYFNAPMLARSLEGAHAVVHLAALAHTSASAAEFAVNDALTTALVTASREAGVSRFVLISSIGVNGSATHGRPFTESDASAPAEPYAASKLRSERAVAEGLADIAGASYTILRPPLVYGPDAPGNFRKLVRAVGRGWPLPLRNARNARSLIGVDNLVDLVELCLTHPAAANELFLAADGEDVSTRQMVELIARGLGRPARLWPAPARLARAMAGALGGAKTLESLFGDLQVDASKARTLLGWRPRTGVAVGIERAARDSGLS